MGWQWHQLDHICKSFAPCCRQTTMPALHHSIFAGQKLFQTPSQQCQTLKAKNKITKILQYTRWAKKAHFQYTTSMQAFKTKWNDFIKMFRQFQKTTRAKDVLPNINCTQAAKITRRQRQNGPICCYLTLFAANTLQCVTQQNGPLVRCWKAMGVHSPFFVPGEWWPWHSNSSKRGTKHVFPVNLAEIRSAVHQVFDSQTNKNKKSQTAPKTEPYTVHCVQ